MARPDEFVSADGGDWFGTSGSGVRPDGSLVVRRAVMWLAGSIAVRPGRLAWDHRGRTEGVWWNFVGNRRIAGRPPASMASANGP